SGTQAWSGALNRRCRAALISSIRLWNSGSRWPMVGRASADSTRGLTSDGPGPMRMRRGGWKLCISTPCLRSSAKQPVVDAPAQSLVDPQHFGEVAVDRAVPLSDHGECGVQVVRVDAD